MDKQELIEMIYDAQEHMRVAYELLATYVNETNDQNARAYLVDKLRILLSADHGFLTYDINCDTLIGRLEGQEV